MRAGGQILPLITLDAVVVGSGCAGFNAADWLYDLGADGYRRFDRRRRYGYQPQHRQRQADLL